MGGAVAAVKLISAQAPGARLERIFGAIMPHKAGDVRRAFGHPSITGCDADTRAGLIYEIANACAFASVAVDAINYADSLLTGGEPAAGVYRARWGVAVEAAWAPAANYRPVPTEVKLLKKGSPNVPTSVRYIGHQLERAATVGPTNQNNRLLRDILKAWCLGTFTDPRPVHLLGRKRLLALSHRDLYNLFMRHMRASDHYDVINAFTSGLSERLPVFAWALKRHSMGVTTPLPTHSYTAIARRVLAPKNVSDSVFQGVPDHQLRPASAAMLRVVSAGGTSKRVKAALLALDNTERQAVRAAVTKRCPLGQVPLDRAERARHARHPPCYVMWCDHCQTWRLPGCTPKCTTPLVRVDLSSPGVAVCGSCGHSPLVAAKLNGTAIGCIRMCSECGVAMTDPAQMVAYQCSVVCTTCWLNQRAKSRPCVLCSAPASNSVLVAGAERFRSVYLCATHYPGPCHLDPLTPVDQAIAHLSTLPSL